MLAQHKAARQQQAAAKGPPLGSPDRFMRAANDLARSSAAKKSASNSLQEGPKVAVCRAVPSTTGGGGADAGRQAANTLANSLLVHQLRPATRTAKAVRYNTTQYDARSPKERLLREGCGLCSEMCVHRWQQLLRGEQALRQVPGGTAMRGCGTLGCTRWNDTLCCCVPAPVHSYQRRHPPTS